jgi:hypothetical protein
MLDVKNVTVRASVHADLSAKNQHIDKFLNHELAIFYTTIKKTF